MSTYLRLYDTDRRVGTTRDAADGTVAPATVDLAAAFRASAEMLPASVYPRERAALLQAAEDFAKNR